MQSDKKKAGDERVRQYAETLGRMIRTETVQDNFHLFRDQLRGFFPVLFGTAEYTEYEDSFTLRGAGQDLEQMPLLFMNHHDVVEAQGKWSHPPFSGEIADGRLWGRGTLDDKGGLWAMLQAAEELAAEGFRPQGDIWFFSASTEESTGKGAPEGARRFAEAGIRFRACFDEGGFIVTEPVPGIREKFAMIGVGEKGCADLKFIARSSGGHASVPARDSPLVRLGKFMAEADKQHIFKAKMNSAVEEMLRVFAPYAGAQGAIMAKPQRHRALLTRVLTGISPRTAALLRTTVAFTMAKGSDGANVIPAEAWVTANMRYSHHQGQQGSFDAIRTLAEKYGLEMEVLDPGNPSGLSDFKGEGYRMAREAVEAVFPAVKAAPFLMTGASDSRFMDCVCDQCIRFLPFDVTDQQTASIHGLDENVSIDNLVPAVEYYKFLIRKG